MAARSTAPAAPATADTTQTAIGPDPLAVPPEEAADLAPVAPVAPALDAPVQQDTANSDAESGQGDVWGYMAGLLALLGIGGGAIALRRTRTRKSARMMEEARLADANEGDDRRQAVDRPLTVGATAPVHAPSAGRFDEPVMQTPAVAPMAQPHSPSRPAPVVTREGLDIDQRRLEYLIAQKPSRDNPFKTRANRKRRAIFLLRNSYAMQTAA